MKKIAMFLLTTLLLAQYSFAESTDSNTAPVANGNNGFDITSTTSGTTHVSVPVAEAKETKPVSINESLKIVATKKHEENGELPYTIDVNYPQIAGDNLSKSAKDFNQLVVDMVNKSVQQFKNYVKADMPHMQTLPDSQKHNSFNMDYKVDVLKPGKEILISLRLSIEGMQAGRAHPYHAHQVLNFNLSTGKVIEMKNLFKPKAKYLNVFAKYSSLELNKKLQDKWMIKDGTAPVAKNYQQWNLSNNGIVITFEEYQVGPYVAGSQEVEIPYSQLKNLIAHNSPIIAFTQKINS